MALNLSPEKGVKLTKKDRAHVMKKMKQGWKATAESLGSLSSRMTEFTLKMP